MVGRLAARLWQIPFVVTACCAASVTGAWAVSRLFGFAFDPSVVAVTSALLAGIAIGKEWRSEESEG